MGRVLVVGGRGSLGKALVRQLLDTHSVRTLDVSIAPPSHDGLEHLVGDVRDPRDAVDSVVWAAMPNLLSAPAHQFDEINVTGVNNLLRAAEQSRDLCTSVPSL